MQSIDSLREADKELKVGDIFKFYHNESNPSYRITKIHGKHDKLYDIVVVIDWCDIKAGEEYYYQRINIEEVNVLDLSYDGLDW